MALKQSFLSNMNEDQLRTQILIPLFNAMGFSDVFHHHGGSEEKGKDIVMWKPGDIRERVNFGVVVKATKISGKASGRSSAADVRFQIEQCFSEPYADPVTTKEERVDYCFVISHKEITKGAVGAIKGILKDNNLDKVTDFIGGDKLLKLVEEHMPERTVFERLQQVHDVFDKASPHYSFITQTEKNGVKISLKPKYPGAEQKQPIKFSASFAFPNTPEGQKIHKAFESHMKTGTPVTLTKPYIRDLKLPEFLTPFIDPSGKGIRELTIGSPRTLQPLLLKAKIECNDGQQATLDYIHLEATQVGMDEMTLTNEKQPVPWKIQLVLNNKNKQANFNFTLKFENLNVKLEHQALQLQHAFSKGGLFSVEHLETGLIFTQDPVPHGTLEAPNLRWMKLVEKLVYIQKKTYIPLYIPDRAIQPKEAKTIYVTAQKLKTGRATFQAQELTIEVYRKGAEELLEIFKKNREVPFKMNYIETEEILGVAIPLGPVTYTCKKAYISEEDFNDLQTVIEKSKKSTISIRYKFFDDFQIEAEYQNWISQSARG